jgi:hypothetical protein
MKLKKSPNRSGKYLMDQCIKIVHKFPFIGVTKRQSTIFTLRHSYGLIEAPLVNMVNQENFPFCTALLREMPPSGYFI